MIPKIILISEPAINLARFASLLGQSKVNKIDSVSASPIAKFAKAVDECLNLDSDWGFKHLHYTFYVSIPYIVDVEMRQWEHAQYFRTSLIQSGMLVEGLLSAPYDLWGKFLRWAEDGSEYLKVIAKAFSKELPKFII